MNAIDPDMMDQLVVSLQTLEDDEEVKVIILKGEGDCFSAGGDLSSNNVNSEDIRDLRKMMKRYGRAVMAIQQTEKPVIAMVKGYAIGGAMSLALACDIILAAEDAKFVTGFLQIGLTPEMGSLLFLPLTIGMYKAKELWFTGRKVSAQEAYDMGFVNRVLPAEEIEEAAIALAKQIAQMPQTAVRITKRIANSIIFDKLPSVLESESIYSAFGLATEDHRNLIGEFRKRSS
jgi:2-(1,2-epoxy-1,2-dihydrophenyl)acetyl-CoA isomerase